LKLADDASKNRRGRFQGDREVVERSGGRAAWAGAVAVGTSVLWTALAFAGPADLDVGFGTGGLVVTPAATAANAVLVQGDGDVVAAGSAHGSAGDDFVAVRYGRSGQLDPSFGNGGVVIVDFLGLDDAARAVVLQPDGHLVLAGVASLASSATGNAFALVRLSASGIRDASFGSGGKVTTDFGGDDEANAVALQTDGEIVAAGFTSDGTEGDFALARYTATGLLDPGFGSGGKVRVDLGGDDEANAVLLQPDGKIVVAGVTRHGGSGDFALVRLLPNGTPDIGFGAAGRVTTDLGGDDAATALVLQADGKLVAAGVTRGEAGGDFALVRYDDNGILDGSFGNGGKVITDFGGDDGAAALVLTPDGLVAVGSTSAGQGGDFALARYTLAGGLDGAFGNGGKVTTDFSDGKDVAHAAAVQADGKIVAGGSARSGTTPQLALARYGGGGAPVPPKPPGPGVAGPTTTTTQRPFPTVESLEAELDDLVAAIAAEIPAGPIETVLAALVADARTATTAAGAAQGDGRHRRAVTRLGKVVRMLARLRARLRSHAVRREVLPQTVTALDVDAQRVQDDTRILQAII
jgi:uncharacterized delta-60 repeat protein